MKEGWVEKKLGDVATLQRGFDLPVQNRVSGAFSLISSSGIIDSHHKAAVKGPGVVTGRSGSIGNVFFIDDDFWPLNTTLYVKDFHGNHPRFVFHLLKYFDLGQFASGSGVPTLNRNFVHDELVLVPTSIAEQQRIVAKLEGAFTAIAKAKENAEKNVTNARTIFESHLQSIFTHRGKGWVETTLGSVGKVSMCKRIFKEETTTTSGIPFYKIGTFGKKPDAFIPNQIYNEYRSKYAFPKKGDVLISASGTIGRRVRYDGEPAYFQDSNIVWIDNDEKHVLNEYMYHFYGACDWNSTKGATISRLYNDNLRRIVIAFPESLQEQRQITERFNMIEGETRALKSIYQLKLVELDALKQSLLHHAFTGQL